MGLRRLPRKAPRPCPRCGRRLIRNKARCSRCERDDQPRRERYHRGQTAAQRGYDARWRRARLAYLSEHPLCRVCAQRKRVRVATVVDHIKPHRGDDALFWDEDNWQPLCKTCHAAKTARGE